MLTESQEPRPNTIIIIFVSIYMEILGIKSKDLKMTINFQVQEFNMH